MSGSASSITNRRRITILLFTVAAGSVDAIVYLAARVFTANMTGNAVLFGIAAGQGKALAAAHSIIALLAFIAGIVVGTMVVRQYGKSTKWTFVRNAVLLEAVLLALFAAMFLLPPSASPHDPSQPTPLASTSSNHKSPITNQPSERPSFIILIIVFSGLAMGLQSAVVKRLNLPGIATTYITGTMTNLFSGLVHHWGRSADSEMDYEEMHEVRAGLRLQAEVFLAYALAAVACGALYLRWPAAVALLPVLAIGAVTIYMFVRHRQLSGAGQMLD